MKHTIIAGCLALGLAACQDFDKGDVVAGKIARVMGDPCLLSIQIDGNNDRYGRGFVARLETPACKAPAPAADIRKLN